MTSVKKYRPWSDAASLTQRLVWVYTFCTCPKVPFPMTLVILYSHTALEWMGGQDICEFQTAAVTDSLSNSTVTKHSHNFSSISNCFSRRVPYLLQMFYSVVHYSNAKFLISHPISMVWTFEIVYSKRIQWWSQHRIWLRLKEISQKMFIIHCYQ